MTDNERLVDAAMPIVRALRPPEVIRRNRRVDRAIDQGGRVINQAQTFVRLIDQQDGSIWRVKVVAGAITLTRETA